MVFVFCLACISIICWKARRSGRGEDLDFKEQIQLLEHKPGSANSASRFVPPGKAGGHRRLLREERHLRLQAEEGCACLCDVPEWKAGSYSYTKCGAKIGSEKHL